MRDPSDPKANKPKPKPKNELHLTPDDEAALDRAWETITDAEIEASITWINEQKPSSRPAEPQP